MKLSQCKLGEIVVVKGDKNQIGHVVGLDRNSSKEVIAVVQFVDERNPRAIHHNNLEILKD